MSSPQLANSAATPQPARPDSQYEYWRWRILFGTMIGYIFFYFVRKSITMAMPGLEEVGVTKTTLGLFLTIHGVLYGVSRFVNGIWSDRVNPRYFMSIGLFLAALTNVFCGVAPESIGSTKLAWIIGTFWIINGWVQGMGFPPCAKSLTHWFAPREHGVKFATWNISHSLGAGLLFILNSFVVGLGWHYCFLVPAALSMSGAIFLFWALRDAPEKEGFEPVEQYYERTRGKGDASEVAAPVAEAEEEDAGCWANLRKHVFSNWAIWVLCWANFFVYVVRFSILDWAPTFLTQAKGVELKAAGWATASYEIFGAFGIILSGFMMDKLFKGRGAKACFYYMLGCAGAAFLFWKFNSSNLVLNALLMSLIGFFIYGPQCLIGCVASTVATKKAAAASSGLTGLFGYLSTLVTGLGVGVLVDSATAPVKAERDQEIAAIVQIEANDENLAGIVKAAEGLYDADRRAANAKPEKAEELTAKAEKARTSLTEKLADATGAAVSAETVDKVKETAGLERAKIAEAGWPRVFGMLVVSSFIAAALFALILNLRSPELVRAEEEAKAAKA
ncbi:MAG: MFS transporter [Thermoguttaceae bacterium]|nr:MFS transporter [Thermoguttaceae bacterium]